MSIDNSVKNEEPVDPSNPIKTAKVKRAKRKGNEDDFYVNPKEFTDALVVYYETGQYPPQLGGYLLKIAQGLSFKRNFINYWKYKEDMVGDALVKMTSALENKKFDLEKGSSPFSYYTTIAFNAFINRLKKEQRREKGEDEFRDIEYSKYFNDQESDVYIKPTVDDEESSYD
jgi:hypothetical protein